MGEDQDAADLAKAMAFLRSAGRVYRRRQNAADVALGLVHEHLVKAYRAGASVAELSEASGLSRPAVYRHLDVGRNSWPVV